MLCFLIVTVVFLFDPFSSKVASLKAMQCVKLRAKGRCSHGFFFIIAPLCNCEVRVAGGELSIGRFQKISIPYHGRLLGFPKGRGGSRLWNSEGEGGFTIMEF